MPNIGSLLKQEISRLSRKEARSQIEATRKATSQHRRHIAELNRQVAQLARHVSLLQRKMVATPAQVETEGRSVRFVAKGLRSKRERLGLSAADYGKLIGVTAQTVYNWERQVSYPRPAQLEAVAALRGIGKKEARLRLDKLNGSSKLNGDRA